MTIFGAAKVCLGKYARFSGRASRVEYWKFVLFVLLMSILMSVLDGLLFESQITVTSDGFSAQTNGPLGSLFGLVTMLPLLAAGWRRMHDTGRSGIFLFYPLIALIGVTGFIGFMAGFDGTALGGVWQTVGGVSQVAVIIAIMVLFVSPLMVIWWLSRPSQPGDNPFGPAPADTPAKA